MTIILAGDIGRQTTLKLIDTEWETKPYENSYRSADERDLASIVKNFLRDEEVPQELRRPEKACFAIPGPIDDPEGLKNLLAQRFGWNEWNRENLRREDVLGGNTPLQLINDFEAVGYGVANLNASDYYELQPGNPEGVNPNRKAMIAVIGAGSGLGEAFIIMENNKPKEVCASEGGRADFAPNSKIELELWEYLQQEEDRFIDVELVVSGKGIVRIYKFLRDIKKYPESPYIAKVLQTWEKSEGQLLDPAAEIAKAALFKSDRLCERTMQRFMRIYGAEAGTLALKLLPYGGIYIAGSIAPRILPLFNKNSEVGVGFLDGFNCKGERSSVVKSIPVRIVLNQQVGLKGAEYYAKEKMN